VTDPVRESARTSDFEYELTEEMIGREPAEPRDSARLLVALGVEIQHRRVGDLAEFVGPGDVIVLNSTRVLPARVPLRRETGGAAEVLLLEPIVDGWWEALVRPSRKVPPGTLLRAGRSDTFGFEIGDDLGDGRRLVLPISMAAGQTSGTPVEGDDLLAALELVGQMPLPPYLGDLELSDPERYQTVFSERAESAAAPTAGLHLTEELIERLRAAGATIVHIELVVGLGTFRPISADHIADHEMHHERYRIPEDVWASVQSADRVIAVGTTSVRALESAAATGVLDGSTNLFISLPYPWRVVDVMMTNFHQPRSSLLVMIDAFVGRRWREIYRVATDEGYRFLSFGDAMLLGRDERVVRA